MHQLVGSVDAEHVEHTRLVADRGELDRHSVWTVTDRESRLRDQVAHVEHDDASSRVEQRAHEVAADEPSSTGDERRPLGDWPPDSIAGADVDLGRAIPCS